MMSLFVQWYPFIASLFLTSNFINYGLFISGCYRKIRKLQQLPFNAQYDQKTITFCFVHSDKRELLIFKFFRLFIQYIYIIYIIYVYVCIYMFMYIYVLNEYMCIYIYYTL